jgi:uncharacterized membrane protein YoaK (UPF0700 family)
LIDRLHLLLLAGFLVVGIASGPRIDPNATIGILAGMLGVSAMAVQHALVQVSLKGAPATAVMTSNVTRFAIDVGELLHFRLRPRCGVRGRIWSVVSGVACRPCTDGVGDGACG